VIYTVRHRTTYKYEGTVAFARCVLRLTPQSSATQTVTDSVLVVTPAPSNTVERTGPFGEHTVTLTIETPHKTLVIEARSRVDVHTLPPPDAASSPPWERVRAQAYGSADIGPESPATYLYPTARTPILPRITDYARTSFTPGRPVIEAASDLMTRIYADFAYDSEATDVRTPASEAFAAKRGVCQDFAHIMISALKGLGLPAGYVSGYLRTLPPPGQPRLEGADATHAWIRLWCGGKDGWIGFDPTNALIVRDDHIVLAVGRDYSDVAPIDGIMLGSSHQALKVEVDVIPEGEDVVLRPAFGAKGAATARAAS
jgi:transglutaminase-like putative cysteine protease